MHKTPIVCWVEHEQKLQVEKAAKAKGLSMSGWCRYYILTALSEIDRSEIPKLNAVPAMS